MRPARRCRNPWRVYVGTALSGDALGDLARRVDHEAGKKGPVERVEAFAAARKRGAAEDALLLIEDGRGDARLAGVQFALAGAVAVLADAQHALGKLLSGRSQRARICGARAVEDALQLAGQQVGEDHLRRGPSEQVHRPVAAVVQRLRVCSGALQDADDVGAIELAGEQFQVRLRNQVGDDALARGQQRVELCRVPIEFDDARPHRVATRESHQQAASPCTQVPGRSGTRWPARSRAPGGSGRCR